MGLLLHPEMLRVALAELGRVLSATSPKAERELAIKLLLYRRLYKDLHGKRAGNEKQMKGTIVSGKQAGQSASRGKGYQENRCLGCGSSSGMLVCA